MDIDETLKIMNNLDFGEVEDSFTIKIKSYSPLFNDSTMSRFLILRENNKFTRIDNVNVIIAVNTKFIIDIEGNT